MVPARLPILLCKRRACRLQTIRVTTRIDPADRRFVRKSQQKPSPFFSGRIVGLVDAPDLPIAVEGDVVVVRPTPRFAALGDVLCALVAEEDRHHQQQAQAVGAVRTMAGMALALSLSPAQAVA